MILTSKIADMESNWRLELQASLRRLEAAIPHLLGLHSWLFYADNEYVITRRSIGSRKLKGSFVCVKIRAAVRPYRLALFNGTIKNLDGFKRHAIDLSDSLNEIHHPRIGNEWASWDVLDGALSNGLIAWTLALHAFARASEADFFDVNSGMALLRPNELAKDKMFGELGSYASNIECAATTSAKAADWILHADNIGLCSVELFGQTQSPVVMGKALRKPLSIEQYRVIEALKNAFPAGLTEAELQKRVNLENPRHTLLNLRGELSRGPKVRSPTPQQLIWRQVILPPMGEAGVGWRLSSS